MPPNFPYELYWKITNAALRYLTPGQIFVLHQIHAFSKNNIHSRNVYPDNENRKENNIPLFWENSHIGFDGEFNFDIQSAFEFSSDEEHKYLIGQI